MVRFKWIFLIIYKFKINRYGIKKKKKKKKKNEDDILLKPIIKEKEKSLRK